VIKQGSMIPVHTHPQRCLITHAYVCGRFPSVSALKKRLTRISVKYNNLLHSVHRPALGPTQPPIKWIPRALSREVKRSGREANYAPLSSVEVNKSVAISPLATCLHDAVLN
jgi:hypothetical protein